MDEIKETEESTQFTSFTPVVIFDGDCDHDYQLFEVDSEGVSNLRCTKCPMGIMRKE